MPYLKLLQTFFAYCQLPNGVSAVETYPGSGTGTLTSEPLESISNNGILNVGETWTYDASYTVTQADIDANIPLINTISVRSTEVPGPTTDDVSTPVEGTATISVEKIQTSDAPITDAGQIILYDIVLTNTGSRSITGVNAVDMYPGAGEGLMGAATESISNNGATDVGETWTYRASYRVTQADIDAGVNLINTIRVVTIEGPWTDRCYCNNTG